MRAISVAVLSVSSLLALFFFLFLNIGEKSTPERRAAFALVDAVKAEIAGKPVGLARTHVASKWPKHTVIVAENTAEDVVPESLYGKKVIILRKYKGGLKNTVENVLVQYDGTRVVGY